MIVQEFALPDLPGVVDSLFSDRYVVAITPSTGNSEWASSAAWSIARSAAATGRRTALVDLDLENPTLHTCAVNPQETGIVDAFLFGASLQHVASQDEDPNLHFIGVGTPAAEAGEVLGNDRWSRLSRGFRKEEAVLLLYVPPSKLAALSLTPDLIIALSPTGFGPAGPRDPHLRSSLDRGMALVAMTQPFDDTEAIESQGSSSGKNGKLMPFIWGFILIAVVVGSSIVMSRCGGTTAASSAPVTSDTIAESALNQGSPVRRGETTRPVLPTPTGPVDTLAYSIQVAAWARPDQAFEHYAELAAADVPATISAVSLDSDRVWYRVFAGAVADRSAAAALRERLRAQGTIGAVRGVLANTPFAFLLATQPDTLSARRTLRGLRERGVPAYIVSMPDGSGQILVGAFETPDQAELADSVLPEAERGLARVLVTRVGIAR